MTSNNISDLTWLENGIKEHADIAYRICLRIMENENDAADAFQNGCLTLIRRAKQFRQGASLRAWICGTMRWASLDLRKKEKKHSTLFHNADKEMYNMRQPVERKDSGQIRHVREAVKQLPELDRTALELRYYEGLSDEEVGVILKCKTGTASKRIRRALDKLRHTTGKGVAMAVFLSLSNTIAEAENKTHVPGALKIWMEKRFLSSPVLPMNGWGLFKEGIITMIRNPIMYAVAVTVCTVGIFLNAATDSDDKENTAIVSIHSVNENEKIKHVEGNNAFAIAMYKTMTEKEKGNFIFSPYSIRTALAMTYAGAKGKTADQMRKALIFSLDNNSLHAAFKSIREMLNTNDKASHTLSIVNALWGQQGYTFLQPFLDTNKTYYDSGLNTLDFRHKAEESRKKINLWVENRTNKRITDLIPQGGINGDARLVLTNAVYFYGYWEREFSKDMTKEEQFFINEDQSVPVQMMTHKTGIHKDKKYKMTAFKFIKNNRWQAVELPYQGNGVSMVIFLPKGRTGLTAIEKELANGALAKEIAHLDKTPKQDVIVHLPKWKTTWGTKDLGSGETGILSELGMKDAFTYGPADFSGMDGSRELYIGAVFHKAFVDVNEQGTEAAAATAVVMDIGAAPKAKPIKHFRADHPFLYVIRENSTGSILFMGRMINPSDQEQEPAENNKESMLKRLQSFVYRLADLRMQLHEAKKDGNKSQKQVQVLEKKYRKTKKEFDDLYWQYRKTYGESPKLKKG